MRFRRLLPYVLLIIGSVIMLFPFIWMVSTSLKAPFDIFNLSIIPENPTLANYIKILEESMFIKWFMNSIIVALITTISVLFFDTLVGYIIAKFSFVGRTVIFILILSTLMVPTEMLIIPWYMMSSEFGWTDSYWGVLFPGLMTGFGVFLMRQFMEQIPDDLLNAARVDGMNEYAIFFKIAVPQVWPAISALGIFTFLSNWNAFLWPLIVIESPSLRTLPVGLSFFSSGEAESQWHLIMTGATISVIPLILVFILLQRHIIKGITLTGMK
ncbi:carbohydrate ABC transporter permease [Oceanobacillus profundus]|uniref:Carbohydrate ABC transporter permease n=1 Tax=Oceanobacillus profundus TaxID=372463 RepID=A0A417YB31_9BACI|nr:carbohydrate ABC transporter permease [Oceanobacillus profundus]MBR3119048.1 carbohydrate ABC transporter permease [Oceanobacillus sp.]PAE30767.1 sugar ABC transporter permease [Paenibacillus sp. 7884-2]MCM3398344.1 carbohydrate ABC transporter permease [Oceanobacillus profundus]MDO6451403.1 carbohydrate ABC transporter permease [Oceanobacillus profundus]RHW29805.1 carbohydrate ABC transporter permease [Oceanobacillus profundus]